MQPKLCSRCGQNIAIVFVTKIEGEKRTNEGLCLKCARELNIKPIDDLLGRLGVNDDDLNNINDDMISVIEGLDQLTTSDGDDSEDTDEPDEGKTATFPFFQRLFGDRGNNNTPASPEKNRLPAENILLPDNRSNESRSTENRNTEKKAPGRQKLKFLDSYCINLNERAFEGKLDRMIGRKKELERVIQILNRRQKNNPCLIGEPGVGKTAIAEGLAQAIVSGQVPYKLRDKVVYLLDLTALVAGTQFRGQFEARMKGLITDIKKEGNVILVIDEVHSIVGAGDAEGSMNAANILKPALSRGEIQVIGATTFTEYRKHIEKDSALERRFQPVTVDEPSIEDSIEIIKGIAHYYEDFHNVRITDEMCEKAVRLSERYITDRFLPDKAIDLIDEAGSKVNLQNKVASECITIEKEIADLEKERELLMSDPDNSHYERLADIRCRSIILHERLDVLKATPLPRVTEESLAEVIELWTKIPASGIKGDELGRLVGMNDRLKSHIIGQDEAVDAVCRAVKRGRVGLKVKKKPVSFIFVGGTGVGKTELVKRLAEDLFSTPESLIRLDMSEFMEKFAVSRIIGSPPGYVGYDEAGQLTEKIRRRPYSVVLFDEIEKAHPDVMNILLQILDDGHITDAQGRQINFENAVIVMTSNAGSGDRSGTVGFGGGVTQMKKEKVMKALADFLRPEFLNRVDEVICFNQLSEDNFKAIAEIMLGEVKDCIKERDITLTWDSSVLDYLVKKAYSITYGARNLRRTVQQDIEDGLAEKLIEHAGENITNINITVTEDKISFNI